MHGWYRARIEQLFAHLWHWGLVRNIWRGGPNELHQAVRVLLHFTQFCNRRRVAYTPYGPWEHVPSNVWAATSAPSTVDDCPDEEEVCALCCQKRTTSPCGECKESYCAECIGPYTCGEATVYVPQ